MSPELLQKQSTQKTISTSMGILMGRMFIVAILIILVLGCQNEEHEAGVPVFELVIENVSTAKIYPELLFENMTQSIGVLTAGHTSTYGFCPIRVGDRLTVSWTEIIGGEVYQKVIDTKPLVEEGHGIYTLKIVYMGGDKWDAQTLDKNKKLLKRLVESPPNRSDPLLLPSKVTS